LATATAPTAVLTADELRKMDAYWRAANYLSVGQIYLMDNPLLKEPLELKHIKPRLLGHWGTTPGLNLIYVHFNRAIKKHDLDVVYICGPGHGGPGMVANAYLEGTYSEVYTSIGQDEEGIKKLFKQFSFPGEIPSHAAPETPGSMHEGGSWATLSRTPSARRSTIRTCSSAPWWAMARPRPDHSPRAGTQTSFSTPAATAPCCRSCISTATRSLDPRFSLGSASKN
jgi:phosphoketolase